MGSSGSECRRSEGPGGGSGAEGPVVVVVLDIVGVVDGGCVAIVKGEVAAGNGGDVLVTRAVGSSLVWVAVSMVVGPTWVLASLRLSSSASFATMAFATSVTSIRLPSSTDTQCP